MGLVALLGAGLLGGCEADEFDALDGLEDLEQDRLQGSCPQTSPGVWMRQGFESFPVGTPALSDEKSFKKLFCTALHYIKGFGADAEKVPSSAQAKADMEAREAAGQYNGASDQVRVTVAEGSEAHAGNKSLRVTYIDGGNTSSHSGAQYTEYISGTKRYDTKTGEISGDHAPEQMYVSYWVKLEDDFLWQHGGKLPGMIAEQAFRHPDRDERVNSRLMWREDGKLEFYLHTAYDERVRLFWDNGQEIDGHAALTRGQWHHIEFRMKLNDVDNGQAVANGELEGWLDGEHAGLYTDLTFRVDPEININTFFFSTFFGGSSGDGTIQWWPSRDVYAWFDEIQLSDHRLGPAQ
ncbi:MAG: polysaccharide lyase [Myxococcota bacterium]